jgi:hypothetical protein
MRTTVDIHPDLAAKLRSIAQERDISFKEALNAMLRAGLGSETATARPYRITARRLGLRPGIDLDRALHLAAAMDDEEFIRKAELRK